jgi:hypothetical protein
MAQFYFDSLTYTDESKNNYNLKIIIEPISEFATYRMLTKGSCIKYSQINNWCDEVHVSESSFDEVNKSFIIEKCSNAFIDYLYETHLKKKDVKIIYNKKNTELVSKLMYLKAFTNITFLQKLKNNTLMCLKCFYQWVIDKPFRSK